ncbi:hypothetical protein ACFO25_09895 [Paenactinomyces guangxiensis]|uniref:Uncharacterized protein n=1 Tax=Paenactinomyces guangxiensis TaxID=1490290 RepID=A0A7W1WS90_9BACL|nr:hypothetical protein [Paenactinomyces guangxiensis]MBA4495096.1 hypothetical protein [Paenactinomyces guangxiensis]MBH8592220.1 hypothetical protein [Paenactinomyces guangxiensis]
MDMPLSRLSVVAESIQWRTRVKNYDEWKQTAVIAAILISAFGKKKMKPENLIGKPPKRFPNETRKKKYPDEIARALEKAKERGINPGG